MPDQRLQPLPELLLNLLPADHSTVGNITLLAQFLAAAQTAGHQPPVSEEDFKTARDALVAAGLAVKGKGRGGATARATGARALTLRSTRPRHPSALRLKPLQPRRPLRPGSPTPAQIPPDLVAVTIDAQAQTAWSNAFVGDGLFIADPMGNVIMRYDELTQMRTETQTKTPSPIRGVHKDLERLLKYSWIH